MASSFSNENGTFYIPGAYPSVKVQNNAVGVATTGVCMLIGEADAGPDYTLESDITLNYFGPDSATDVVAKYKSGPIVDAFRAAATASSDPNITGSPSRIYIAKTNKSTKASTALSRAGLGNYGTLYDKSYGSLGNLLYTSVSASTSEVAPTTGAFTYIPQPQSATVALRINGGAQQTLAVSALTSPASLVGSFGASPSGLNSLSGVYATGGIDRGVMAALTGHLTLTRLTSSTATITTDTTWAVTPSVGDTLVIPANTEYGASANSVIWGALNENAGAYIVTAATSNSISVTKLAHDTTSSYTLTTVSNAVISATPTNELKVFSPVVLNHITGTDRGSLTGLNGTTLTVGVNGTSLTATLATGQVWAALPQVGDYLYISPTSVVIGGTSKNSGWYKVSAVGNGTGVGASYVTAIRLNDGNPEAISGTISGTPKNDLQILRPVVDGLGKIMSVYDGSGTTNISNMFYVTTGAGTKVSWLTTSSVSSPLTSASEYVPTLSISRQVDATAETWSAGGDIALLVGYNGTSATCQISATQAIFTVSGGSGASFTINLASYTTLNDLAAYVNAQTGFACKVATSTIGQLPPSALDEGTFGICTSFSGMTPGRIKKDAYAFYNVLANSAVVQLGNPSVAASSGLPEVQAITYLASGARGITTDAYVTGAIDAMAKVQGNFLVPLFSQDASLDIVDGLTDSGSTYHIDSINAYAKTHVIAMSTTKKRKNRQALCSKRDTFAKVMEAAGNLANARVSLTFQDVKNTASDGTIKQFQPWMASALAAGMQAAAFYKAIFNKGVNCSGVLQAAGDFNDQDDTQIEKALQAGLLIMARKNSGGIKFISDQTTYGVDNNFVYNSMSTIYNLDTMALSAAQDFEDAFVGQSLSDVSAGLAMSYLQGIMADFLRLKLIAPSDDAPKGWKNAVIKINGNSMTIQLEVKPDNAIKFVVLNFTASAVQQTATN